MNRVLIYLLLTILCIVFQAIFSMFEMASVSFNKARLQFYVGQKIKRAVWLNRLVQRPTYLFGTTIICVTFFMQAGSECARRFYEALRLDPELSAIPQIVIVLILAELAPLFAARNYSEQVALSLSFIAFSISRILAPLVWLFDFVSHLISKIFGKEEASIFMSKEEIQKIFENQKLKKDNFGAIISSTFSLKSLMVKDLMLPINDIFLINSDLIIKELKNMLPDIKEVSSYPVYHGKPSNIVAVASLKELIIAEEKERVIDFSAPPWFIDAETSVFQALQQFRHNGQYLAVILDDAGNTIGIITIDDIIDEIFQGHVKKIPAAKEEKILIEKTVDAEMPLQEFNKQFNAKIAYKLDETLNDLLTRVSGKFPSKGEIIIVDEHEFEVLEPSLLGAKTILVRTVR